MVPVIQRLATEGIVFDTTPLFTAEQGFAALPMVKSLNAERLKRLVYMHRRLDIEYTLLLMQIEQQICNNKSIIYGNVPTELQESISAALQLAELLTVIYDKYLYVPREVVRLGRDERFLRKLIFQEVLPENGTPANYPGITFHVRNLTANSNFYRLLFTRARRVLSVIAQLPYINQIDSYRQFASVLDNVALPLFSYVAWLFYLPRLVINTRHMLSHTFPHPGMSQEERNLGAWWRVLIHLDRRWFELTNDWAWVIGGVLNCFVLVGPLAPVGGALTVSLFAFDAIAAAIRAYIELSRLKNIETQYKAMLADASTEEGQPIELYLSQLTRRIDFESKRLGLSMFTTSTLFIGVAVTLPMLSLSPSLLFLGAAIVLTITVLNFILIQYLEHHRPAPTMKATETLMDTRLSTIGTRVNFFKLPIDASANAIIDEEPQSKSFLGGIATNSLYNPEGVYNLY